MKIRSFIAFVLLGGMLLSAAPIMGQDVKASNRFANKRVTNPRVTNKHALNEKVSIYHGIVATLSAVYFSGDIVKPGDVFINGAMIDNISGSLALNYKMTINVYVSMRFGVQGALLRGSNKRLLDVKKASSLHELSSTVVSPFAGVEVYPILNYGFFIYAGFGFPVSFIDYKHQENGVTYKGKITGLVPTFQLGLGYNWWLTPDWTLGIELLGQIAVWDGQRFGMDGWPIRGAYNHNNPESERRYKSAKDPDGLAQLGLVVSYHF